MLKKENTSLFGLIGVMGVLIIIGSYAAFGVSEMLLEPPTMALATVPVFIGSIFSGMSMAQGVKKYEKEHQSIPLDIFEVNSSDHYIPSNIKRG